EDAVQVEVGGPQGDRSIGDRDCDRSSEPAVAVPKEDCDKGQLSKCCKVLPAVPVEIPRGERSRIQTRGRDSKLRLERPVSPTEQDRDIGGVMVRYGQVRDTVSGKVRRDKCARIV